MPTAADWSDGAQEGSFRLDASVNRSRASDVAMTPLYDAIKPRSRSWSPPRSAYDDFIDLETRTLFQRRFGNVSIR